MIYLNILPQKEKREFNLLSIDRILNYYLFILFLAILFFMLFIFGAKYFLIWNSNVFKSAIEEQRTGKVEQNINEFEKKIREANQFIQVMYDINNEKLEFSGILDELSSIRSDGISFNNISFGSVSGDKKEVYEFSMEGFAKERENFLEFLGRIEESDYFTNVDSPLSNLVKKEDLSFRITFRLE